MDSSGLVAAVVVLGILSGLAILVAIPILVYFLYTKRSQAIRLQQQLDVVNGHPGNMRQVSQINSLPCRLKKQRASNGGNRSAGESGVYDMTDMSTLSGSHSGGNGKSQPITASFTDGKGVLQKLFLYGELSPDDTLIVKSVLARHIQVLQENGESNHTLQSAITSSVEPDHSQLDESILSVASLDDVIIAGLEPTICFENEGYKHYDNDNNNHNTTSSSDIGSGKRRRQVKKSLSALSNRVKHRIEKQLAKMTVGHHHDDITLTHTAHGGQSASIIGTTINASLLNTSKSAVIGQTGGEIILESGVKLTIPPNALSERTEIIIGVTFDKRHRPQLSEEEALLTPVVFCQPSGLEFRQPATLTLPHCAVQVQENWRINILRSQTDVDSQDTDWKHLQIGDYESRVFYKHTVDICVNHFTMYSVSGTSKDKRTAYKQKKLIALSPENNPTTYSVYCVNNYRQKQRADQLQVEPASTSMNIEGSGQSVKLSVDGINESNVSFSPDHQICFENLWHDNLEPISLTLSDQIDSSGCELCGWQVGNTSPRHKTTLQTRLENNIRPSSSGSINTDSPTKKRAVFSETLKWDIMLLLDSTDPDGNDWRKLAEELGLPEATIQTLENSTSPTKELLKTWEDSSHGCIRSFVASVVKINRLDVAEKVEQHVGKLYLETLPNHKCNDHC